MDYLTPRQGIHKMMGGGGHRTQIKTSILIHLESKKTALEFWQKSDMQPMSIKTDLQRHWQDGW